MHTAHPTLLCAHVCLSVCLTVSEASEMVKQDQSCTFSVQWRAVYQSQELREVDTYGMHICGVMWCVMLLASCVMLTKSLLSLLCGRPLSFTDQNTSSHSAALQ